MILISLIAMNKQKYKILCKSNIKNVTDNKFFSENRKVSFSYKSESSKKIVLIENDEMVMEDGKVALKLNTFFFKYSH